MLVGETVRLHPRKPAAGYLKSWFGKGDSFWIIFGICVKFLGCKGGGMDHFCLRVRFLVGRFNFMVKFDLE